jgi:hypothetical protein
MSSVVVLIFVGALIISCAPKGNVGDYIPQWAGGAPKNLPPATRHALLATRATILYPNADRLRRGCLPTALSEKKFACGNLSYSKRKLLRKAAN